MLVIGDIALEHLDADGLIDQIAATGNFAKAHTDTAAGGGHGVFLQNHTEGMFRLAVADVVNITRHVDLGGTGFDAGRRHIGHAVLLGDGAALGLRFKPVAEVFERTEQRLGAGLAKSA